MGDTFAQPFGWGMEKRLAFARTIGERSVDGPEARALWQHAIDAIQRSPKYGGLVLRPQMGLLPLREDPRSGLWEFAHLQSGEPARVGADGWLEVREETGIVLVLVPGGEFWMGSQQVDALGINYDPMGYVDEGPPHEVTLTPYFISKYEMTQAQWMRATGSNPSSNLGDITNSCARVGPTHPVERVSCVDCERVLHWFGLSVPSEAQWERACRGGTDTPWSFGASREDLRGKANLADSTATNAGMQWLQLGDWPDLDDGWCLHCPVGTFPPNPFGLHEVHGNVFERCVDRYHGDFYSTSPSVDPVAPPTLSDKAVQRGGSFFNAAKIARSSYRLDVDAADTNFNCGVRPARRIDE